MATSLIMLDDIDPAGTLQVVSFEGAYYVGHLDRNKPDGTLGQITLTLLSGPWPVFSEAYMRGLGIHEANQRERLHKAIEAAPSTPTTTAPVDPPQASGARPRKGAKKAAKKAAPPAE